MTSPSSAPALDGVAIVGMSGRFPGAPTLSQFWKNLVNGAESIRFFSDAELAAAGVPAESLRDPNYVKARSTLADVDLFDASFFGYTPHEAAHMDPQQRVFLETAWEALEDAGCDPMRYPGAIGLYAGSYLDTYLLHNLCTSREFIESLLSFKRAGAFQTFLGNDKDYLTTRVAYKLNLKGPALTVQTACSTSLVAVCSAFQSLLTYQCDMAIAGGVTITFPQAKGYLYSEGGMLSPDGHCRAFDANAQGTVFGSGIGLVVLKRLQEAVDDGDHIYAVIKGAALNNDGSDKVSYTAPSVNGQAAAILTAQTIAGVSPDTIGYVEAHGTATPLGDPIEIAALTQAFRVGTQRKQFCAIGSVKTNVGHLDVAAGVCGLIKTSLALKHGQIPPSLNFERPNPKIDFANSPFYVNAKLADWKRGETPRRAAVSSFGVGGTNAHVVLEEAPAPLPPDPGRPAQLLLLSARTETALDVATARLRDYLDGNPSASLADVAFTLQTGRREFNCRRALVCRGVDEAKALLAAPAGARVFTRATGGRQGAVVFMFPGQGAQYIGMAGQLRETEPVFREALEECFGLFAQHGVELREIIYPVDGATEATEARLRQTQFTQPALFAIEYALARLWLAWGCTPSLLIGHSLGEFVAACVAGVFSLPDAVRIVARRASLVQAQPGGAMLGVRMTEEEIRPWLGADVSLAAINAPNSCVVSGPDAAIAALEEKLKAHGAAARRLKTSHAFHSAMMAPVVAPLLAELRQVRLAAPRIPCVSNVTGKRLTDAEAVNPEYWAHHLMQPVRFADGIGEALRDPNAVLLEVGPGAVLAGLARQHPAAGAERTIATSLASGSEGDSATMLTALARLWLAGASVDWTGCYRHERRHRVPLPTYPFERKRFFIDPPVLAGEVGFAPPSSSSLAAAPEASAAATTLIPSAMSAPNPVPPSIPSRRERVVDELRRLFQELAGVEIADADRGRSFLELGLDSLFLTQARQTFQTKFNVNVSYRQLAEDLDNLDALADFIDAQMPADALPAPAPLATPTATSQPVVYTPPVAVVAGPPVTIPAGESSAPAGAIERVVEQQMQVMSQLFAQQLAALRGTPVANVPVAAPPVSAPSAGTSLPVASAAPSSPVAAPAATATPKLSGAVEPKAHGPYRPPVKGRGDPLSAKQREFLHGFSERYLARTAGSKRAAQAMRRAVADPRSIANYRPLWKELVYQIVIDRSEGANVWDIDGNQYLDITMGFGANLLGHRPPFIIDAIQAQLEKGTHIGPQSPLTAEVADLFRELTGMERVTFCNTGSEAVMAAIRVARTVTRRSKIVYFNGDYHGLFDEVLLRPQPGGATPKSVPVAPGIPACVGDEVWILEYGAPAALDFIKQHGSEIAAVIVEPVQSRNPTLQPREFVHALREITKQSGSILVFDEIITGFRVGPRGAQGFYGVEADLATYGKIVGGGLPIGVLAGGSRCMDALDGGFWQFGDDSGPEADVTFFAGTFVRHPLALAAARATLRHLKERGPELQAATTRRAARLGDTLNAFFDDAGVPISIHRFASQFRFHFAPELTYATLFVFGLLERGIFVRETHQNCFLSSVHTDADVDRVVDALKSCVADLQNAEFFPAPKEKVSAGQAEFPLTDAQREIWLACQLGAGASCAYNESFTLELNGSLAIDALQFALDRVVARHEALRLAFKADGTAQRVLPAARVNLPLEDWSGLSEAEAQARRSGLSAEESGRPFDLVNGPLVRVRLCRLAAEKHLLVFTAHHLVCDGWSSGVILGELSRIYTAQVEGRVSALPKPTRFRDYVANEAAALTAPPAKADEAFWRERFKELPPPLELPTDFPRAADTQNRAAVERGTLSADVCAALKRAAAAHGGTLFAALLAGFKTVLQRLSGQHDTVVGIFTAGQATTDPQGLVGHCVNMLPIRTSAGPEARWSDFLRAVNRAVLDAREHGSITYGRLLQCLKVPRTPGRAPLLSAIFNLDRQADAGVAFGRLQHAIEPNPHGFVTFDLFLNLRELKEGIAFELEYNAGLFAPETIRRWVSHFETVLAALPTHLDAAVGEVSLLSERERHQLLVEWNATALEFPRETTLDQLISAQAARTPDAVAIIDGYERIHYAALEDASNRLAQRLRTSGVSRGKQVGVCAGRSWKTIAALLGVLKAGGAYVPLDPAYPARRLREIASDAQLYAVITESLVTDAQLWKGGEGPARFEPKVIALDVEWPALSRENAEAPQRETDGSDVAYVIYTSGSTGQPKGVAIEHHSAVSFVSWAHQVFSREEFEGVLAGTSLCFDLSIFEVFATLSAGGKVILAENALALARLPAKADVRLINTVPSVMAELLRTGAIPDSVTTVNLAGEPLPTSLVDQIHTQTAVKRVYDLYGPTECTTYSTFTRRQPGAPATIGRPIANTQVYIVDAQLRPLPVGATGELCIGGEGVARGYLNRDALTAEKFVTLGFLPEASGRVYRTGDLARFRPDGTIEYLGRRDQQVKIRGYRIEPGEIEAALQQHPAVRACAVVARRDGAETLALVAYVVPTVDTPDTASLRAHLQMRLPEYMVPSAFVALDRLPLTPNGKLDRAALPAPVTSSAPAESVQPRTTTEEIIADFWREVLELERVGVTENFFELGGHSLLAMRVISRIRDGLGVELSFRQFFGAPTVTQLATLVEASMIEQIKADAPPAGGRESARNETARVR